MSVIESFMEDLVLLRSKFSDLVSYNSDYVEAYQEEIEAELQQMMEELRDV